MNGDTLVSITSGTAGLHAANNLNDASKADGPTPNNAIQVKRCILDTAIQLNLAILLSRNVLLESIEETKAFERTSQSLVDVVHARFFELNDSIISQREILKARGMCSNSSGYFYNSSGTAILNATA